MKFQDEVQVPTQIHLKSKKWGNLITKHSDPIRWFKLLLLDEKHIKEDVRKSPYLTQARAMLRSHPRYSGDGVVDLIAQFLKELWDHSLQDIGKQIEIDKLPLRVAVTVPAIWPSYARARLKEAAKRAGIEAPRVIGNTRLTLVEEPEAAALCTLHERRQYPEIEVGETFIVCDCGGGTVVGYSPSHDAPHMLTYTQDIISYKVKSVEPFQIEEAVMGEGKIPQIFQYLLVVLTPNLLPQASSAAHFLLTVPLRDGLRPNPGSSLMTSTKRSFVPFSKTNGSTQ